MDIKFESLQIHKDNLPLKDSANIFIDNEIILFAFLEGKHQSTTFAAEL